MKAKRKLSQVDTREISLVDKPANMRKFLLLKAADAETGEGDMPEPTKKVPELGITDEAQAEAASAAVETLKGVVTANPKVGASLASLLGIAAVAAPPAETDTVKQLQARLEVLEKAETKDQPTIDLMKALLEDAKKDRARVEELEKNVKAEREIRLTAEYLQKAETAFKGVPGKPAEVAKMLRDIDELPAEKAEAISKVLETMSTAILRSTLLEKALGRDGGVPGTAEEKVISKARELVAKDAKLTLEAATDQVIMADAELAAEYRAEMVAR